MESMRQRNTFALPSEELEAINRVDLDEDRVLDEQEQEEVIQFIRENAEKSDRVYVQSVRMIFMVSIALQFIFLTNMIKAGTQFIGTPISALFNTRPQPLIPCADVFAVLTVALHAYDFYFLSPKVSILSIGFSYPLDKILPGAYSHSSARIPQQALYIIAPVVSLLLGRDYPQTLFWSIPVILMAFVIAGQRSMRAADKNLEELEKLRYKAKGA